MQATVFCKTTAKATQSFFVKVGGRDYFLFQQDFRKSNKEFFRNGVGVHAINNYSGVHSTAVRKTLDKLPSYIRYIEKEYDVAIQGSNKIVYQNAEKVRFYKGLTLFQNSKDCQDQLRKIG